MLFSRKNFTVNLHHFTLLSRQITLNDKKGIGNLVLHALSHLLQSPASLGFMLRFVNIFPLFRSENYELKLLSVIFGNIKLMVFNKKILLKKVIQSYKVFIYMDFQKNKNNLNSVKLLDKLVKCVFILRKYQRFLRYIPCM